MEVGLCAIIESNWWVDLIELLPRLSPLHFVFFVPFRSQVLREMAAKKMEPIKPSDRVC